MTWLNFLAPQWHKTAFLLEIWITFCECFVFQTSSNIKQHFFLLEQGTTWTIFACNYSFGIRKYFATLRNKTKKKAEKACWKTFFIVANVQWSCHFFLWRLCSCPAIMRPIRTLGQTWAKCGPNKFPSWKLGYLVKDSGSNLAPKWKFKRVFGYERFSIPNHPRAPK